MVDTGTAGGGEAMADLLARDLESVEGRERVADHGVEVERARRLIERPEGFGTAGVELGQVRQGSVWELAWREGRLVQGAQQRERVEAGPFQA